MAPAHKQAGLPNGEAPIAVLPTQSAQSGIVELQDNVPSTQPTDATVPPATSTHTNTSTKAQAQTRNSWYTGGAWRSKASPVAQVARESISVDKGVSSESSSQGNVKPRSGQSVSKGVKGSRKSIALIAEATRVHATSDVADKSRVAKPRFPSEKPKDTERPTAEEGKVPVQSELIEPKEVPSHPEAAAWKTDITSNTKAGEVSDAPTSSNTWLTWWSRPDGYGSDGEKMKRDSKANAEEPPSKATGPSVTEELASPSPNQAASRADTESQFRSDMKANASSAKSWFGLWSKAQNQQATVDETKPAGLEGATSDENCKGVSHESSGQDSKKASAAKPADDNKSKKSEDRPKAAGWAFWSAEKTEDAASSSEETKKHVGELAVADTPSQSHPEAAQYNEQRKDTNKDAQTNTKRASTLLRLKRTQPAAVKETSSGANDEPQSVETAPEPPAESTEQTIVPAPSGKRIPQARPNLILPAVHDTYPPAPSLSTLTRLTQYVAQSLHLPGSEAPPPPKHPYLSCSPPKVKKAIAIGVHGFFPAAVIQKILGQPTGTSIKFANCAAAAIKQWCQTHQPDLKNVEIEKVALEGEGYIADRVATLWKLLLNWLSHLRQADFILVACHSQGVPVATMLVAKLIQLGCLSPNARIGICAMAGINLGPFAQYKSRLFGGIALELFDFRESASKVSVAYLDSLDVCLRHGVRVTFVGSLDDQLVSLESSLHAPLSHPYVNRAVFVDGRLHASSFLTHLVAFAIKLRNLGADDHGLIREVSAALAGNIVGGEGHSRLYDEPSVYLTAVEYALESTQMDPPIKPPTTPLSAADEEKAREAATQRRASLSSYPNTTAAANSMRRGSLSSLSRNLPGIAPTMASYEAPGSNGGIEKNPYVLPWAVRGMLAEDIVKKDAKMQDEVKLLVKEFEEWKPTSKVLRDVRWRLEGVRSML